MKRGSDLNVFDLETTMRKKAAVDLQRELDDRLRAQKVLRFDDKGNRIYTMDTLPASMIHLGDQNFIQVTGYSGLTRVDIRKYVLDDSGGLRPTKDGVSLSPAVWHAFSQELLAVYRTEYQDGVVVTKKDVCFARSNVDGKPFITIQRLFQRKDLTLEFTPNRIVLTPKQIDKLNAEQTDNLIFQGIKTKLISYTLKFFVKKETFRMSNVHAAFECDPDHPGVSLEELTTRLIKWLKNELSIKINELFACAACEGNEFSFHKCFGVTAQERYNEYFLQALYALDWEKASKNFVHPTNILDNDFRKLVFTDDFFNVINIDHVFNEVEKLYLEDD